MLKKNYCWGAGWTREASELPQVFSIAHIPSSKKKKTQQKQPQKCLQDSFSHKLQRRIFFLNIWICTIIWGKDQCKLWKARLVNEWPTLLSYEPRRMTERCLLSLTLWLPVCSSQVFGTGTWASVLSGGCLEHGCVSVCLSGGCHCIWVDDRWLWAALQGTRAAGWS